MIERAGTGRSALARAGAPEPQKQWDNTRKLTRVWRCSRTPVVGHHAFVDAAAVGAWEARQRRESAVQLEKAVALLDDAIAAGAMTAASIAVCRGSSVVLSRGVGHSCMPGREPVEVHA